MKILLLNQVFYPDVVSTAQHLGELAAALVERGHEVAVITGRRAYDDPEKLFVARENWRGVRIFRVFSTCFGKQARWRRATDFASFIFSSCARLAFLPRHDVVVALTTPPLISFIGMWRAKLWRARFCYWVMDLNPDEAVAAGWLRAESLVGRMLERMSRSSLRRADRIIALDRFMRNRIMAKGIATEKIAVIPPWSHDNEVHFDAVGREQFRKAHGLQDKFVIMYSGNHSPVHPLDTLMRAAEKLQSDASIIFCFVGGGSEFKRMQRWAKVGRHPNVLCLPYQPLNRLAAALSAADTHVVVMGNDFVGLVHPCKIYNILNVGSPVLYIGPHPSHLTEILDVVNGERACASLRHGDVDGVIRHIAWVRQPAGSTVRRVPAMYPMFSAKTVLQQLVAELESADCPRSLPLEY